MDLRIYDQSKGKAVLEFRIEESAQRKEAQLKGAKHRNGPVKNANTDFKKIAKMQIDVLANSEGRLSFCFSLDKFEESPAFLEPARRPRFSLKKQGRDLDIKSGIKKSREQGPFPRSGGESKGKKCAKPKGGVQTCSNGSASKNKFQNSNLFCSNCAVKIKSNFFFNPMQSGKAKEKPFEPGKKNRIAANLGDSDFWGQITKGIHNSI